MRSHLEHLAEKGVEHAKRSLEGPEPPETMLYLRDWAYALLGRSGVGMDGFAPLGYPTIDAWARLTGVEPTPEEINALLVLDAVLRRPDDE